MFVGGRTAVSDVEVVGSLMDRSVGQRCCGYFCKSRVGLSSTFTHSCIVVFLPSLVLLDTKKGKHPKLSDSLGRVLTKC